MSLLEGRARQEEEGEESYFVSMTDMMVGLLFIFIIMLMYFAIQYKQTTHELTSANETRSEILTELKVYLTKHGVPVEINEETGVLRLPDQILFDKGSPSLSPDGRAALVHLSQAMTLVLPCYAFSPQLPPRPDCKRSASRIDAIFIEGHTDADPIAGGDNWVLSVQRATNTYHEVVNDAPLLQTLLSRPAAEPGAAPILSVSGYGPTRPLPSKDPNSEDAKKQNRRIDIRFIMATPELPGGRSSAAREIQRGIETK